MGSPTAPLLCTKAKGRVYALKSGSDAVLPPISRLEAGTGGGAEQVLLFAEKRNEILWRKANWDLLADKCDRMSGDSIGEQLRLESQIPSALRNAEIRNAHGVAVSHLERARDHGVLYASYLTVYDDGRLLQLHLPGLQEHTHKRGARGKCEGMSDNSRRRLMHMLHTIIRDARNPAFVTLTFPDECIPSPREAKAMVQTLFKRWKRRCGRLCAVWRIEAHPERSERLGRPVPHFHLLVWGGWIDREELSRDWSDIVCGDSAQAVFLKHLAAGTKVESIRSFRGVASYASKYISKADGYSLGDDAGRVWGVFNKEALPIAESRSVKLTQGEVVRVVRWAKRYLHSKGVKSEWMPKTLFMERPNDVMRILGRPIAEIER